MARRPLRVAGRAATTAAAGPTHPVVGLVLASKASAARPPSATAVASQRVGERQADYPLDASTGTAGG
jgi:hypothetical protein